jgi:hypothetical protein
MGTVAVNNIVKPTLEWEDPKPEPDKPDPEPEKECCCKTYYIELHFH